MAWCLMYMYMQDFQSLGPGSILETEVRFSIFPNAATHNHWQMSVRWSKTAIVMCIIAFALASKHHTYMYIPLPPSGLAFEQTAYSVSEDAGTVQLCVTYRGDNVEQSVEANIGPGMCIEYIIL